MDAPVVKMKDGVILLGDDDDDNDAKGSFEADTASAIQQFLSLEQTNPASAKTAGGDVVELADSDDEDSHDAKPTARATTTAVNQRQGANEDVAVVDEKTNERNKKAATSAGDVADLT